MAGKALEEIFFRVGMDGKPFFKGLKDLNKKTKGIFKGLAKLAGVSAFAKMAFDAQKLGRELGLIADKTGIAASKLSKMQSAFAATGGDAKTIGNVLTGITSGLAKLSMGDATMASRLSAMNISAWDEGGNVKKSDIVLGEIADWTKAQLDAGRSMQEVSQFLQDNFNIPQELANQLALGKEGFASYQEGLSKKIGSLDESEISNLQSLNTSLARFKETINVLVEKITAGVGPALEFFIDLFQVVAKETQDIFSEVFGVFGDLIGDGTELKFLFEGLKVVIRGVADAFKLLVDVVGIIAAAFRKLGEWIGNFLAWIINKFSWFGPDKTEEQKKREEIAEKLNKGEITFEEAKKEYLAIDGKLPIYDEEGNLVDIDKVPFAKIPIYDEAGNPIDLSQVPDASSSKEVNIHIENQNTINATGETNVDEIQGALDNNASNMVDMMKPAINGGMA